MKGCAVTKELYFTALNLQETTFKHFKLKPGPGSQEKESLFFNAFEKGAQKWSLLNLSKGVDLIKRPFYKTLLQRSFNINLLLFLSSISGNCVPFENHGKFCSKSLFARGKSK